MNTIAEGGKHEETPFAHSSLTVTYYGGIGIA